MVNTSFYIGFVSAPALFPKRFSRAAGCPTSGCLQVLRHTVHPVCSAFPSAALPSCSALVGLSSWHEAQLIFWDFSLPVLCVRCCFLVLFWASLCLTSPSFFLPRTRRSLSSFTGLEIWLALLYYFLIVPVFCFSLVYLIGACIILALYLLN